MRPCAHAVAQSSPARPGSKLDAKERAARAQELALQKYTCVVSCQVYGNMRKRLNPKADDIE